MKSTTLGELARRCGGTLSGAAPDVAYTSFTLDSREPQSGAVFLAIAGAKVDGHDFVSEVIANGAVAAVVERPVEAPHILVPNLVDALATMAHGYRDEFPGIVIGVTGSAGKTTTKEFVAAGLAPLGQIAKTEGNRNTEFTAPLLWAELDGDEKAVVVEMSMRGFGQIDHLAKFSRPTIGIVTNVGHSHVEKVGNRLGIAKAKSELFENLPESGLAIGWQGDPYLGYLKDRAHCDFQTFGFTSDADAQITAYQALDWGHSEVTIAYKGKTASTVLPVVGRHLALNAAAAAIASVAAGVSLADALNGMRSAQIPGMRMQPIAFGNATIVMDNYNASPNGFVAALETMAELPCEGRRIVVAGEMKELGDLSEESHRTVGRAIARTGIDVALFLGDDMNFALQECRTSGMGEDRARKLGFLFEVSEFLQALAPGDVVLIKGSRAMELEKAVSIVPPTQEEVGS